MKTSLNPESLGFNQKLLSPCRVGESVGAAWSLGAKVPRSPRAMILALAYQAVK